MKEQQILYGILAVALGFVLFGVGAGILSTVIGIVYPTYMSIKALESAGEGDDQQWLTYWCVYAFIHVAEQAFCCVLGFLPFYHVLKVGFLIWLWHPKTVGAHTLYQDFFRTYLVRYGDYVDQAIDTAAAKANEVSSSAKGLIGKSQ